jgi:hypothetical protein
MRPVDTESREFILPIGIGAEHEWFARSAAHYLSSLDDVGFAKARSASVDSSETDQKWEIKVRANVPSKKIKQAFRDFCAGFDACAVLLRTITERRI